MRRHWLLMTFALLAGCLAMPAPAFAQDEAGGSGKGDAPAQPASGEALVSGQRQVSDRFRELEKLLLRMAELTAPTDPRRAALLRQAVARSSERDIDHQFDELVKLLGDGRLSAAVKGQGQVQDELARLLELLLSEDRTKRLESEKERVREYLRRVNKIIKEQKSVQGDTARDGDPPKLADRQGDLAEKTGDVAKDLAEDAAKKQPAADARQGEPQDKPQRDKSEQGDKPSDGDRSKPGEKSEQDKADGDKPDQEKKDSDGAKDDDKKARGEKEKDKPDKKDGKDAKGDPKDGDEKSQGKPGEPQNQVPPPGQESQGGESGQSSEPQNNPAHERLKRAQQRMKQAQQKLEEAKRKDAQQEQAEALKELEQAKAELEEILRQLREEEMARTLAMLEARFRKMLDAQVEVYEGTKRLDKVAEDQRDRDDEIESGRLSRKESQIVTEADKALTVLKEEGSAVAFPEAVAEMRDDMNQVAQRLAQAKVGEVTQGIEKDIIAALEEMIAALKKAQKDMEQKSKQGDTAEAGEDSEPPLVDTLSELKMIRALQMRVNLRTQRYAEMTKTEQAEAAELIEALRNLSKREERIHKVTRDIVVGRNR